MSRIPQIAFASAFLILLLYNGAVYAVTERERQDMSRRARISLEEILSTKEFKTQDRQLPWWFGWAERLFRRLPGELRWLGIVLEWLFYLVVVFVIISAVVFIARRFRRLSPLKASYDVPTESQRHMDPELVRAEAYECYQRGEYRQAIRYLYLSLLLYLDKARFLTYDACKTNGEYLSEVLSGTFDKAERFASLTLLFERKWYGTERSSAGDFQQCEAMFTALIGEQTQRWMS